MTNHKTKRKQTPLQDYIQWKPFLHMYKEVRVVKFSSERETDRAIDLLWTDELRTLPNEIIDDKTILVPAEAVPYFSRRGLNFTSKPYKI